ncbi:MAG: threonine/serine dehydratase [Chloroflexi bacterium]|nr:MAG: threonine/serine dehydratase [Chloroflexota bacterium]MBL1193378.1 threonine/serine dehydratase [Chloroflexota bacterium]NOH10670.1 threonine/serine dehydratase [Chloroflexota bacterium]
MDAPSLDEIRATRERLGGRVLETPVWRWDTHRIQEKLGTEIELFLKMEMLQYTGSFKPRGAFNNILSLDDDAKRRGVTGASAGNHAMGLAYAAQQAGVSAKVVMPKSANPAKVAGTKAFGAEVVLVDDIMQVFEGVERIQKEEGRHYVHPFEGPGTVQGTATVGFELCNQLLDLDAVIVPIGGGGLIAGVSRAVKLMQPDCVVYGVEPEGADTMHRSFASGQVESIDRVTTIADGLGSPTTAPYSLDICRQHVDELVKVTDTELRRAMLLLFEGAKLVTESAGAAGIAALVEHLADRLRGKRVAVVLSGANIDLRTFWTQVSEEL